MCKLSSLPKNFAQTDGSFFTLKFIFFLSNHAQDIKKLILNTTVDNQYYDATAEDMMTKREVSRLTLHNHMVCRLVLTAQIPCS